MSEKSPDKQKQGRSNRRKGGTVERAIVKLHTDAGIDAKRVPLSGASRGYKGDIRIEDTLTAEAKSRKGGAGFAVIEKWLGDNDMLFLHRNRAEPLVVMPMTEYLKFAASRFGKGEK